MTRDRRPDRRWRRQLVALGLISERDSYSALAAAAGLDPAKPVPIVVLTADDGPALSATFSSLARTTTSSKPFDPDVLLARVNAVFRRIRVPAA